MDDLHDENNNDNGKNARIHSEASPASRQASKERKAGKQASMHAQQGDGQKRQKEPEGAGISTARRVVFSKTESDTEDAKTTRSSGRASLQSVNLGCVVNIVVLTVVLARTALTHNI